MFKIYLKQTERQSVLIWGQTIVAGQRVRAQCPLPGYYGQLISHVWHNAALSLLSDVVMRCPACDTVRQCRTPVLVCNTTQWLRFNAIAPRQCRH